MSKNNKAGMRHPKGAFAMSVVYSFTGASILASIIFSLLLFLSIDDDPWMKALFGALAVIFELGKFFAWYEFGERMARRNLSGAFSAFTFYAVLAAISIGGSIGGINSATNTAQRHVDVQQSKVNGFNLQISAIEKQIALNNVAAEKYIEMQRIATGVARIQSENAKLRQEQVKLALERDSIPVASQGSVLGLLGSIGEGLNISAAAAQLGLVVFLSVLLDLFAAFFVGLIGEELRFKRTRESMEKDKKPADSEEQAVVLSPKTPEPDSIYQKVVYALTQGEVRCSKKAVASQLNITGEEVDRVFATLLKQGLVTQKPNRHFNWQGQ